MQDSQGRCLSILEHENSGLGQDFCMKLLTNTQALVFSKRRVDHFNQWKWNLGNPCITSNYRSLKFDRLAPVLQFFIQGEKIHISWVSRDCLGTEVLDFQLHYFNDSDILTFSRLMKILIASKNLFELHNKVCNNFR